MDTGRFPQPAPRPSTAFRPRDGKMVAVRVDAQDIFKIMGSMGSINQLSCGNHRKIMIL